jgi:hypothetical protein
MRCSQRSACWSPRRPPCVIRSLQRSLVVLAPQEDDGACINDAKQPLRSAGWTQDEEVEVTIGRGRRVIGQRIGDNSVPRHNRRRIKMQKTLGSGRPHGSPGTMPCHSSHAPCRLAHAYIRRSTALPRCWSISAPGDSLFDHCLPARPVPCGSTRDSEPLLWDSTVFFGVTVPRPRRRAAAGLICRDG